jgi:hypothetical protein
MTAVVITPSLDRDWVKPIAALRARGVACVVVSFDVGEFERFVPDDAPRPGPAAARPVEPVEPPDPVVEAARAQRVRALRHALSEFDVAV